MTINEILKRIDDNIIDNLSDDSDDMDYQINKNTVIQDLLDCGLLDYNDI